MLPLLLALTSCQTPTTGTTGKDVCLASWMQPMTYSGKGDSTITKLQIQQFNAGRKSFCG